MGDKKRRFDSEFRAGVVRIVKETGKQVARDLGINPHTLHNWVKADRERGGEGGVGALKDAERYGLTELRRFKAEVAREHARQKAEREKERAELEIEREVLKRSVVLRVKDSMNG
ncbi:transposase [Actinoallomurus sp. CA-150999]|uniref:transposase n=1 Tax=Actinoallomurus sp. CA-150999 TaxID=3239887 RepID=UPI003D938AE8